MKIPQGHQRHHPCHPVRSDVARRPQLLRPPQDALQPRSWSRAGVFDQIFAALAAEGTETGTVMIDATHLKAHRTAASLLRLFRTISDVPEADSTRSSTPSATALAGP